MISAPKTTFKVKNLKILRTKVAKKFTNLPKKVGEFRPRYCTSQFIIVQSIEIKALQHKKPMKNRLFKEIPVKKPPSLVHPI